MSEMIEWNGGECPVSPDTLVEVRLRNGCLKKNTAACFRWNRRLFGGDIVAYRVLERHDMVNSPPHYQLLPGVEVIDVRDALFAKMPSDVPHDIADCWSRSWEYLTRMWDKNGLEDAKKARWYLDRMIKKIEKQGADAK